jgi:hypothetical protein
MNRPIAELGDPLPQGPALYVNYFQMAHNSLEFLIDLGQCRPTPGDEAPVEICNRIVLTPPIAKMLSELLARSIRDHESEHGPIATIGHAGGPFDTVLSSLDEFEERARALRARHSHPNASDR